MANKLNKGLGSWSSDEPAVDNGRPGKKGGNKAKVAVAKAATARGTKPAFGRVLRRTRVTHKLPVYNTCEVNTCTHTHTHKYMYIYIHIYIYIYIYVYVYIYINMCVNIHLCIYVYVYMYLHIYCKYITLLKATYHRRLYVCCKKHLLGIILMCFGNSWIHNNGFFWPVQNTKRNLCEASKVLDLCANHA